MSSFGPWLLGLLVSPTIGTVAGCSFPYQTESNIRGREAKGNYVLNHTDCISRLRTIKVMNMMG
jgi:hypothetical protein